MGRIQKEWEEKKRSGRIKREWEEIKENGKKKERNKFKTHNIF